MAAVLPSPCVQLPCPHQHAACRSFPLSSSTRGSSVSVHSPSSIRYNSRYIVTSLHRPCTPHAGLHIPVYAPTSPYSHPHEPEHSPASFKSSTSKQISCTSRLLHPPRFVRTPDSSVFDSSTRLDRQRHAARPTYSSSLPKHKGSAATSDTTTPNHAYNSPSPPPPVASTPSGTFGA